MPWLLIGTSGGSSKVVRQVASALPYDQYITHRKILGRATLSLFNPCHFELDRNVLSDLTSPLELMCPVRLLV